MSHVSQVLSIFVSMPFYFLFTFIRWRRQLEVQDNLGTSAERRQLRWASLQLFRCRYEGLISFSVEETTERCVDYVVDESDQICHTGDVSVSTPQKHFYSSWKFLSLSLSIFQR